MKVAIAGKGGVGKTTLCSLLAYSFAGQGYQVLAVDADPSPCLGPALGFPEEALQGLRPIAQMEELIAERTGAEPGAFGGYFRLNPRVDDLPDAYSAVHRGIRLLELGAVKKGGSGCICPESVLLRSLVTHILLRRNEVVLLDMYAGVEHLGRATADAVDAMLVVAEPTERSLATAGQIRTLAADLSLKNLFLVGSKVRDDEDRRYIAGRSPGLEVIGYLSDDQAARDADRRRVPLWDLSSGLVRETEAIRIRLSSELGAK
ncbi:MAG: AAA family ATPase [Anaerolineales bacterium]|jgi:CO dehydrogenase maturation factor